MDIFDAHAHIGESLTSGKRTTEEQVLAAFEKAGVSGAMVLPYPIAANARAAHDLVGNFCARHAPTFVGGVSLNPMMPKDEYVGEVERCVRTLQFRAIKFHPMCYSMSPLYDRARIVFEAADRLHVPVIIHTGRGIPFALPSLAIPRAIEFPNLPIILAHSGYQMYADEALVAARLCKNIYLETSWCSADQISKFIREAGAERVMMGADDLTNLPVELAKYSSIRLSESERSLCLSGNARRLFNVEPWTR